MKRLRSIVVAAVVAVLGGVALLAISTTKSINTTSNRLNRQGDTTQSRITEAQAKDIVLADAKVNMSDATFTKIKLDIDDNRNVYDIEFYTNTTEYDYEINATTGQIIEANKEQRKVSSQSSSNQEVTSQGTVNNSATNQGSNNQSEIITEQQAKDIALANANLEIGQVTFTKVELDRDNGRQVYEIEFRTSTTEYDYEIDATTGRIITVNTEGRD